MESSGEEEEKTLNGRKYGWPICNQSSLYGTEYSMLVYGGGGREEQLFFYQFYFFTKIGRVMKGDHWKCEKPFHLEQESESPRAVRQELWTTMRDT